MNHFILLCLLALLPANFSYAATEKSSKSKDALIMIDPGHGGEDYGTYSLTTPRKHEKYLTLATAVYLKEHLTKMGYRTAMTRSQDQFISLDERCAIANKRKATLFVSLHYNSAPNTDAHGIEVFYYKQADDAKRTATSKALATKILAHTLKATKANSRGVKNGDYKVLRDTEMPAILIEGGFFTNTEELEKLQSPVYVNRLAKAIAIAIDEHIKGAK